MHTLQKNPSRLQKCDKGEHALELHQAILTLLRLSSPPLQGCAADTQGRGHSVQWDNPPLQLKPMMKQLLESVWIAVECTHDLHTIRMC